MNPEDEKVWQDEIQRLEDLIASEQEVNKNKFEEFERKLEGLEKMGESQQQEAFESILKLLKKYLQKELGKKNPTPPWVYMLAGCGIASIGGGIIFIWLAMSV